MDEVKLVGAVQVASICYCIAFFIVNYFASIFTVDICGRVSLWVTPWFFVAFGFIPTVVLIAVADACLLTGKLSLCLSSL